MDYTAFELVTTTDDGQPMLDEEGLDYFVFTVEKADGTFEERVSRPGWLKSIRKDVFS